MRRPTAILCVCLAVAACAPAVGAGVASADDPLSVPSLFTRPGELLGHTLRFRGSVGASQAGRTLEIQRLLPDGTWADTASAVGAGAGSFLARWRTDAIGQFTVRAVLPGSQAQAAAGQGQVAAAAPLTTSVTVYRPAKATWFGPGFYGKKTACGQVMSHALMGVAHRTLPCGTPVAVFYGGKSVTVPVVDRGPFGTGARYDLTSAAAKQLAMKQSSTIGVVPQRGAQRAPPVPTPGPYAGTGGVPPTP